MENSTISFLMFFAMIAILIFLQIRVRKYCVTKQIKNKKYFPMNEFIFNTLDDFIESDKKKKSTTSIDDLDLKKYSKHDLINFRNVIAESEDRDRNVMISVFVSTLISIAALTIRVENFLDGPIAAIILMLFVPTATMFAFNSFDTTWLSGKKYLIDLYLQKHYPND